jgi:hypothetical protein
MNILPATVKQETIQKLNETVVSVISSNGMQGFERAFLIAEAAQQLKLALTSDYMIPIMQLQGTKLGFKTDRDDKGGYDESTVKNCLIEAVLTGVQPFGNQFNIIAGNCYITKEGFGHLLSKYPGLEAEFIPALPRINQEKTSAAILMKITWKLNNESQTREIDFAVKMNQFMGTDAVIGKATRKARAWLFWRLTGVEVGDGDATDTDHKVMDSKLGKRDEPTVTAEDLQKLLDEKVASLNKQEFDDAKRIISTNDVNSFKKLHSLLISKPNE